MIIKVKKTHIKQGKKDNRNCCPVAIAIATQTGYNIAVDGECLEFRGNEILAPRSVERFVQRFDAGKKVKPFNFILDESLFKGKYGV